MFIMMYDNVDIHWSPGCYYHVTATICKTRFGQWFCEVKEKCQSHALLCRHETHLVHNVFIDALPLQCWHFNITKSTSSTCLYFCKSRRHEIKVVCRVESIWVNKVLSPPPEKKNTSDWSVSYAPYKRLSVSFLSWCMWRRSQELAHRDTWWPAFIG